MIEIIKINPRDTKSLSLLCELTKEIWSEYFSYFLSKKDIENLIYFVELDVIKDEIKLDNYNYYFIKIDSLEIGYFELHKKDDFFMLSQLCLIKEYGKKEYIAKVLEYIKKITIDSKIKTIKIYQILIKQF